MSKSSRWFYACVAATLAILAAFNVPFFTIDHSWIELLPVITPIEYGSANIVPVYVIAGVSVLMAFFTNPRLISKITGKIGKHGGKNGLNFNFKHLGSLIIILVDIYTLSVLFHNPVLLVIIPGATSYATINTLHVGAIVLVILALATGILSLWAVLARAKAREFVLAMVFIGLASFIATYIHEAGHALFTLLSGGRITYFSALPTHGEVRWSGVPTAWHPVVQMGGEILVHVYLLVYLLARRPLVAAKTRHPYLAHVDHLLLAVALLAWLDFPLYVLNTLAGIPHWFILGGNFGDISLFIGMTGTPPWVLALVAVAELIIGVILIYRGAKQRFIAFFTLDARATEPA